jgi:hypothetical protein
MLIIEHAFLVLRAVEMHFFFKKKKSHPHPGRTFFNGRVANFMDITQHFLHFTRNFLFTTISLADITNTFLNSDLITQEQLVPPLNSDLITPQSQQKTHKSLLPIDVYASHRTEAVLNLLAEKIFKFYLFLLVALRIAAVGSDS